MRLLRGRWGSLGWIRTCTACSGVGDTVIAQYGGMGDTVIAYSAQNYHRGFPWPLNWNAEAENDLAAVPVHCAVFRQFKITQPEIAGEVGGPKIAGGRELIKVPGVLPTVIRRVILNRREQGRHGVNGVRLPQYELVFRGDLIGGIGLGRDL